MPHCARREVIDESRPGTYHVSTRCVRRSSFRDRTPGGLDRVHRQEWAFLRLRALWLVFAIDILDFAILDNEFHVVLRNRPDRVRNMSPEEVVRRWLRLSRWSLGLKGEPTAEQIKEELAKPGRLDELRRRLSCISWYMIMLKEPIARASNIVGEVGDDPELETPALRMPKHLPEAWLRDGLNAANWKEAMRTISRRFSWMARTASAMRRDCRRFVADSSPPPD